MDDIATIREAVEYCRRDAVYISAGEALTRLEVEVTRLRANELDLSVVPEDREYWVIESNPSPNMEAVLASVKVDGRRYDGYADTPRDALLAAVGKIGG